ncbi:MAG: YARHG domain-containing protein [Ruminococcus sp.]
MKKLLSVFILLLSVALMLCGCQNIFSSQEKQTTTTSSTTETTTQGNSELVTLEEETVATTTAKTLLYHSDLLSATFVIPNSWENKYAVEEGRNNEKSVTFYEKENHRNDGNGRLFTFAMYEDDSYNTLPKYEEYGTVTIDDTTYYLISYRPSDVQYDTKNKNLKKAYKSMVDKSVFASICTSVVFDSGAVIDKNGCSTTASTTEPSSTDESGTSATKANSNITSVSGLVFPDISTRKLTGEEIKKKSSQEIQQAINDICALHGYNFTTPSIKAHYQQFSWYKPSSNYSESSFSDIEKYNYELLQKYR